MVSQFSRKNGTHVNLAAQVGAEFALICVYLKL